MNYHNIALAALLTLPAHVGEAKTEPKAANGIAIPSPVSKLTVEVKDGAATVKVPTGMVFVAAGKFLAGEGSTGHEVVLDVFCIGRFEVTNAEWKEFLDATKGRAPRYWKGGTFPDGKANHPVLWVSLTEAQAYCAWVSRETGWKVIVPSGEQWEKAARGPKGGRFPWGDDKGAQFEGGVIKTRFNYNAVCAAYFLEKEAKTVTTYADRSARKGEQATVEQIIGLGRDGGVTGWIDHGTNTGFVNTEIYRKLVDEGGFSTPVGSYEDGKSACGCYDMAGNAYEWTTTLITATNGAEKGKTVNEIRGGSWYSTGRSGTALSTGEGRDAKGGYHSVGFRIAMIPAR